MQENNCWKNLSNRVRDWIRPVLIPSPRQNVWQWAQENVDFSLAMNYDTPIHGPYDPEYMPFWKEPVECLTRHDVREVSILKATRTGGSENMLLNPIRFSVAIKPQPTLYVTSDQLSAERFMDKRIKRGLKCAKGTARLFKNAQATQHDIAFQTMDFRVTWPRAKQAFKQDGWALVLCDEVSTWPEYSPDMARRRTDSYPFPHIVFLSTPDPAQRRASNEDPIFIEFNNGDRREWYMPDPNGGEFTFGIGTAESHGLRWDKSAKREDGTWDYDKVHESAYYLTPSGARVENKDRIALARSGRWVPTNRNAKSTARSYHVTAFMSPFKSGDFGEIAVAFLKATAAGPIALRGFVYEYLAEPWTQDVERVYDDQISRRVADYSARTSYFDVHSNYKELQRCRLMTVDVQKTHFWFVVREWCEGGASCLVEWGYCATWDEIDAVALRNKAESVLVDSGYGERTTEVYEECIRRRLVPCKGDDRSTPTELPWRQTPINPFEGTKRARIGESLNLILWRTDIFKLMLLSRLRGDVEGWFVYRGIERDYCLQITAEERTPKGWIKRRRDNHVLDCEAMQVLGALAHGYMSKYDIPEQPASKDPLQSSG